jgi:2-C-methyl-D-erythritol 4-phosphate cytidylyltransferase
MGGAVRKQYLEVAGAPILLRAVMPFVDHPGIGRVVVVLPPEDVEAPPSWLAALPVVLVAGGAERGDSVWNGLLATSEDAPAVLVHDGARPFVSAAIIDRVLDACSEGGAIAAVQVTDTVKEVGPDGIIRGTPDRERLWRAQTPQGFPRAALIRAYGRARAEGVAATDDAAIYERYEGPVRVVAGSERNIKVTRPTDLRVAEALALAPDAEAGE